MQPTPCKDGSGEPFGSGHPLPCGLTVYLALQPMRCTAACIATGTGGLLPRLFTLITTGGRDGHFLLHYRGLSPAFPLGSMVPYVARTFLPACARRQNGLLFCKDSCFLDIVWGGRDRPSSYKPLRQAQGPEFRNPKL